MNEYEFFKEQLKKKAAELVGGDAKAEIKHYTKVNGIEYDGLSIFTPDTNISPTIPLKDFYESYTAGKSIDEVAERVVAFYNDYRAAGPVNANLVSDYELAKDNLRIRLINRAMNEGRLADMPYKQFLDLAACLYIDINGLLDIPNATCRVTDKMLEAWGKTFDEVYAVAEANMKMYEQPMIEPIGKVVEGLRQELEEEAEKSGRPKDFLLQDVEPEVAPPDMFVMTTTGKTFGAAAMLDTDTLRLLSGIMGMDLYVLPSSIHEVILLPVSPDVDKDNIREMVREINRENVPQGEVLSNQVYIYLREQGKLAVA